MMLIRDDVLEVHDHGAGTFVALLKGGDEYAYHPGRDDPAPSHKALCEMHAAGAFSIKPRPPRDPALIKAYYLHLVDQIATQKKCQPDAGVAATHAAKIEEARTLLEDVSIDGGEALAAMSDSDRIAHYPMLSASLMLHGNTLPECAQNVLEKAVAARKLSYDIEKTRLTLKAAINAAATADEAESLFQNTVWP